MCIFLAGANDAFTSLKAFISVLAFHAPVLGLATPTAIVAGLGRASELGIFIKDPQTIENIDSLDVVIFDKTGTITKGGSTVDTFNLVNNLKLDKNKILNYIY